MYKKNALAYHNQGVDMCDDPEATKPATICNKCNEKRGTVCWNVTS